MNGFEETALGLFEERFSGGAELFFAPGRVNLIGEHVDYNGGRVLPCSLSLGTYAAAAREEGVIRLASADMPGEEVRLALSELASLPLEPAAFARFGWAAYPLGVAAQLIRAGYSFGGFSMAVCGSLPRGSGLSSSASLEVLTCAVVSGLYGLGLDGVTASKLSLAAERECAGVNCGIMDQFVCALGRKDCALLLDTHTLEHGYFPFDLGENVLLIMNTKKPRRLADSKYNERRAECELALRLINERLEAGFPSLCAVTPEALAEAKDALPPAVFRRARHAVTENARTLAAAEALGVGDAALFGSLLSASHASLRDDYEVTGRELDSIVRAAEEQEGVLGARMTGAGFGGCAIALCRKNAAGEAVRRITAVYKAETGLDCEIYVAETGDSPFGRAL